MWPFRKKSQSDAVLEIFDDAIAFASEKWLLFNQTLAFKPETPLQQVVGAFMIPLEEGLKSKFPLLKASPDTVCFLIALKGIEKSGTHNKKQIENELGITLPN